MAKERAVGEVWQRPVPRRVSAIQQHRLIFIIYCFEARPTRITLRGVQHESLSGHIQKDTGKATVYPSFRLKPLVVPLH